jgi:mannan endo-1,4-beta-mannosidase
MNNIIKIFIVALYAINIKASCKTIVCNSPTRNTISLYKCLINVRNSNKIIIGRHNDLLSGVTNDGKGWGGYYLNIPINYSINNDVIKSDIYRLTKQYPALLSIDFFESAINNNNIAMEKNIVNCVKIYYKKTHGIISMSCHIANPWWHIEGKIGSPFNYISTNHKNVVDEIFNGKYILHDSVTVKNWYDKKISLLIGLINELKDTNGNDIPVIIRLFHEGSGNWFWWGHNSCTNEEYKNIYRYTVKKIISKCHNVLFAYSPDNNWTNLSYNDKYMDRYPGDDYVDVIGYDNYQITNISQINKTINQLQLLNSYGIKHNKIVALTETGNYGLNIKNWFTDFLYKTITANGVHVSYVNFWSSWSSNNQGYCIPYNESSMIAKDFRTFIQKDNIIMSNKIKKYYK